MSQQHQWTVTSLAVENATVEVDGGQARALPRWVLPSDAHEGDVLRVTHERAGQRSVLTIEIDAAATKQASAQSAAQIKSAASGGKGDVKL